MEDYRKTPLWDGRLAIDERLDYLLGEMTVDEKLRFLATTTPELPRLGIGRFSIGGEAAHGVEARHDQDDIGCAEPTTSFPQPIGMSATWDTELIRQAGHVTGIEARVLYSRHPHGGLFRWAPTVDMERDPRWGRTEEGYGEDPHLTGAMASAYVRGMQGDDPEHLLISAALKHFAANNVEDGRGVKSSSLDARNRYDYYDEPFRRVIEEGGATSLMTAYNAVNGVPCILDCRVNEMIRGRWGFGGHVVSDAGSMTMVYNDHKATESHAESIARALKAGVDCMTDEPEAVERAAREAFERGLITEADIDRALRHSFASKLRMGLYDAWDRNPWNHIPDEALDSARSRRISLKMAEESVVLLKNDGLLPLSADMNVALVGPLGDKWYQDWYGGEPIYRTTVLDGICSVTGRKTEFDDGLDRILLRCGDGNYAALDRDGVLIVTSDREKAEIFSIQDWGDNSITFFVPRLGRYLSVHDGGQIAADKETIFGWFVKECFHWKEDQLASWDGAVICPEDGRLIAKRAPEAAGWAAHGAAEQPGASDHAAQSLETSGRIAGIPARFEIVLKEDGTARAAAAAGRCDAAVLVLGCCPVINGKETADRVSIQLPPAQRALAQAVFQANPRTVLVLLANYPYGIDWEQKHLPSILLSASGSQDMGTAVARTLFGLNAPAGRLNMTWYSQDTELPDIDDYDIIKTKRTYRFYTGQPLYPFGHGLTYSPFLYKGLTVCENKMDSGQKTSNKKMQNDDMTENEDRSSAAWAGSLQVKLTITNTGVTVSDEVVQIYVRMPEGRAQKPVRQLIGFCRTHDVAPGESREISIRIPRQELRYYDVACGEFLVEEGTYVIEAGASSGDIRLEKEIFISGAKTEKRRAGQFIRADHWDDYYNVVLVQGAEGLSSERASAVRKEKDRPSWIVYRDCEGIRTGSRLTLRLCADQESSITVCTQTHAAGSASTENSGFGEELAGMQTIASWSGKTVGFEDITLVCDRVPETADGNLIFCLENGVSLAGFLYPLT